MGVNMAKLDWYLRSNLKIRHLQLLVTLSEVKNIGKVANHLNVSQPAISKTLNSIEEGMGVTLFERTTKGMEPTDSGLCLVKYAKKILNEMSEVQEELIDISEGRIARISLGVLPSTATLLVPRFIKIIESRSIITNITVRESTSDSLLTMLRDGDLDLVIINLPRKPLGIEFEVELLHQDPIVVVVANDHPLTSCKTLKWSDLEKYPMVLPPEFATTRASIDEFLKQNKVIISKNFIQSVSTLTNIGVLLHTKSTAFLSREIAQYFENLGLVSILPLNMGNIHIDVATVRLKERRMTPAQNSVIDILKEVTSDFENYADDS